MNKAQLEKMAQWLRASIKPTKENGDGKFWFFHHDQGIHSAFVSDGHFIVKLPETFREHYKLPASVESDKTFRVFWEGAEFWPSGSMANYWSRWSSWNRTTLQISPLIINESGTSDLRVFYDSADSPVLCSRTYLDIFFPDRFNSYQLMQSPIGFNGSPEEGRYQHILVREFVSAGIHKDIGFIVPVPWNDWGNFLKRPQNATVTA